MFAFVATRWLTGAPLKVEGEKAAAELAKRVERRNFIVGEITSLLLRAIASPFVGLAGLRENSSDEIEGYQDRDFKQ